MYSKNGSATVGARRFAITITMTVALTATSAGAETFATINGANIDSSVLEVYVQSRTQRPLREVSAQEREGLVSELKDLFILSTQPSPHFSQPGENPYFQFTKYDRSRLMPSSCLCSSEYTCFGADLMHGERVFQRLFEDQAKRSLHLLLKRNNWC